MKTNLQALASLLLATAVAGQAHAAAPDAPAESPAKTTTKHHVRAHKGTRPTIERQIEQLRDDMKGQQNQIVTLQQQLAARDAQLQQVQQQSQLAVQQATEQAQAAVAAQQATNAQNTTAVEALQGSVNDLKGNTASLATTIQQDQAAMKKAVEHPDAIHIGNATISPTGSFIEFATVNRTKATGSDIPTPFTGIPYSASDAGRLSEFEATGRQSRLALYASTKLGSVDLHGYYALDWLSAGVTSNNNQSNSYTVRERELWAQAAFHNGLTITGGQQWSLATENALRIDNKTEVLPPTIDPNYNVGFVWLRQPSFRVTYRFSPAITAGISAEEEQTLTPSCSASTGGYCAVNYLIGQSGTGGGLYNSTATYTYALAPALLAKVAFDTKKSHFELFGIERNFRNRVYGNVNPATGKVINAALPSAAGAFNDGQVGGGVGGSGRVKLVHGIGLSLKGLYGDGTGRYASAQLPDTTTRPDGQLALLHNFAVLGSADFKIGSRFTPYVLYGTEYVGHRVFATGTGQSGYGSHLLGVAGCGTELAPGTGGYAPTNVSGCSANNKDVREATAGWWYQFYKGPGGQFREGFQYSWVERNTYTGLNGRVPFSPTAIDNVFETSMRYYLP